MFKRLKLLIPGFLSRAAQAARTMAYLARYSMHEPVPVFQPARIDDQAPGPYYRQI